MEVEASDCRGRYVRYMADEMSVLGFSSCRRCSRLYPTLDLQRCGHVCRECLAVSTQRLRPIELANGSTVRSIGQRYRRRTTRGARTNDKVAQAARDSALRRLRAIFPDLYEALLIEERAVRDLEPISLSQASPDINPGLVDAAIDFAEQHFERSTA